MSYILNSIFIHMQRKKALNLLDLQKMRGGSRICNFSQLCKQLVALKCILMRSMFNLLPNHAKFKNIRPNCKFDVCCHERLIRTLFLEISTEDPIFSAIPPTGCSLDKY